MHITSLPLPVETLAVDAEVPVLELDRGGGLFLKGMPDEVFEYRAQLGAEPVSAAVPPAGEGDPALDPAGVTERMRARARRWAGEGDAVERARRIEERLLRDYRYTREFIGRGGESPLEYFLFDARRGHCEYFATTMAVMLRQLGIPARLVNGFHIGEYNELSDAWIVRQFDAHSWVEAWFYPYGWVEFDPTAPGPPRPRPDFLRSLGQLADALSLWWSEEVINYDFA